MIMGMETVLQPMKTKVDALMAILVGQVDWSDTMKNSGYQTAVAREKVSLMLM